MANRKKQHQEQAKKKNTLIWIFAAVVVLGVIAALIVTGQANRSNALPGTVTVQQAAERFADGAFLLDVREQSEWNEAHVEGAVLIPLGELSNRISELPADRDILIICRSGNRSGQARDLLREAGLKNTTSITGGINAWVSAGLPVVKGP